MNRRDTNRRRSTYQALVRGSGAMTHSHDHRMPCLSSQSWKAKVPSSATYGVVVLTTMAETLNRLDMRLGPE